MFIVKFDLGNAAFHEGYGREETARILEDIAKLVQTGQNSGNVFDVNGNRIGYWKAE